MTDRVLSLLLGSASDAAAALPATTVANLAKALGLSARKLAALLKISPSMVSHRRRTQRPLRAEHCALLMGVARMVVDVQTMVEESGDPTGFDAAAWLARWLTRPLPALGWERPADRLSTPEGQQTVSDVLGRMKSGAYCRSCRPQEGRA